ncbi:MAG: DUF2252 family protein [Nocardioides sp.]
MDPDPRPRWCGAGLLRPPALGLEGLSRPEPTAPATTAIYGQLCGWTLARGHARSGDRIAIAAYLGSSGSFDEAMADFATTYADQTERDHDRFSAAMRAPSDQVGRGSEP